MKKKVLKLKGLKMPKLFLFIYGFTNGRMRTASVDSESGNLNSSYIHGKIYQFGELCHDCVAKLDRESSELRSDAESLIWELSELVVPPLCDSIDLARGEASATHQDSVSVAQANRAAAADAEKASQAMAQRKQECESILARRNCIVRRLIEIREKLALGERTCSEELAATADALSACFCAYGHGALLKPINPSYIPQIDYQCHLDDYRMELEVLKKKINNALEKEAD